VSCPSFHHLFIHVQDLERTRRFYVDLLGMGLISEANGHLRIGEADGFTVEVEQRPGSDIGASGIEIVIEVDDVDRLAADLRTAGVDITAPADQSWGARHAWLHDPDGYRLSIYTPQ
jgi:catechol 2,3-dioxygenase-like lactoylglutathione lyase family enzyme